MSELEPLSSPDRLERELAELQARLSHGLTALGELESIQQQFAGLADTYNTVRGLLDQAEQTLETQRDQFEAVRIGLESIGKEQARTHEQHIREQAEASRTIAKNNEEQWKTFRATLSQTQEDLKSANSNLRTEVGIEVEELRESVENRVQGFHELQEQFDSTLQRELESMHGKLDALGFDADAVRSEVAHLQKFSEEMSTNVDRAIRRANRSSEAAGNLARTARAFAVFAAAAGVIGLLLHFAPVDLAALLTP